MAITFFTTPERFRRWLHKNHTSATELQAGFYRKDSAHKSITYPEALDEALCFGWIDGVRNRLDEASYTIRFTPRRAGSYWSKVNLKRAQELIEAGRMTDAGLQEFSKADTSTSGRYSFEREAAKLDAKLEKQFRASRKAWTFFAAQPPSYQRMATWWIVSAKKEETRERRLGTLIEASQRGLRLTEVTGKARKG